MRFLDPRPLLEVTLVDPALTLGFSRRPGILCLDLTGYSYDEQHALAMLIQRQAMLEVECDDGSLQRRAPLSRAERQISGTAAPAALPQSRGPRTSLWG